MPDAIATNLERQYAKRNKHSKEVYAQGDHYVRWSAYTPKQKRHSRL